MSNLGSMRRKRKLPKAPQQLTVGAKLDIRPDTPFYYVNYMAVSHTPYEFTIGVARVPSNLTPEQTECAKKGEPVPLETMLQLGVPPPVIKGLIRALTEQFQRYEAEQEQQKEK